MWFLLKSILTTWNPIKTLRFPASILAGMSISLGCWISLSVSNPVIGAVLFACGLLAVRAMNFDLFTGKTQWMTTDEYPHTFYINVLIGNVIGCFLIALVVPELIRMRAMPIVLSKSSQPILEAFLKGIGCGMLMTIATYKESPFWVSVMCVAAFILAGFNHCIADAFYFLAVKRFSFVWFATLAGNVIGGAVMGLMPEPTACANQPLIGVNRNTPG